MSLIGANGSFPNAFVLSLGGGQGLEMEEFIVAVLRKKDGKLVAVGAGPLARPARCR